jgi:predicted ABC-type transport system involved in lysophospholipase L1 biosynthesis ATPase subunit
LDNAALPLLIKGVAYKRAVARAADAMALLGIEGVSRQTPDELSGGQAQRVAVARVITVEPDLILADEPTGKLDRATGAGVIDLLLEASAHVGAGLVVSTHDRETASRMTEIWSLHDGELEAAS